MWPLLREKLLDVFKAVTPLVGIVICLQLTIVRAPLDAFVQFLTGSALAAAGMLLLFIGIDLGILPMGRFIGAELPKKGSFIVIIAVAFLLGFATTIAEPDVLVLSGQVDSVSQGAISGHTVLYTIAFGVAVFTAIAMGRIVTGWPIRWLLAALYAIAIALCIIAPAQFVPLAFDAGSVTTGVLSAPIIIAVAIGLSSVLAGRSAASDGFGLLGIASVGPVIILLLAGALL